MTTDQKQIIQLMRSQRHSYQAIASTLGISENTIKSYFRRNKFGIVNRTKTLKTNEVYMSCKNCYKQLNRGVKGKLKKFCSEECRRSWWKANENQLVKKAYYTSTCCGCGKEFKSYGNQNRKFCDHTCYINTRFKKAGDMYDE